MEGTLVGLRVGLTFGALVGTFVGTCTGGLEGTDVGLVVFGKEGCDGLRVGKDNDGLKVGFEDGLAVDDNYDDDCENTLSPSFQYPS